MQAIRIFIASLFAALFIAYFPLSFASSSTEVGPNSVTTYATAADLPASAADGATAVALDTHGIYLFNAGTATWTLQGGGGGGGMSIGGAVTGGTLGSVYFGGTAGVLAQDNANLFWDNANNRLGIGTISPESPIDIGRSTAGETEILRATHTVDPDYHNYITSANGALPGDNLFNFWVKDGSNPSYVNPLTIRDDLVVANGNLEIVGAALLETLITSGETYTLPTAYPVSSGQFLTSTTGGVMSWDSPAASIGGAITGGTSGSILFSDSGATFAQDNGNLFWDDTNDRLGLSNTSPGAPLDIGRTTLGESEVARFTYTPDPGYRNYITTANNGVTGANYLKFWLKDGANPSYVSPLTLSDEAATFSTKVVFPDIGIHTTATDTPLGSVEIVSADGANGLVMSLLGDRTRYATIKNNFSGGFDEDNKLRFYVQNAAASQVLTLTLNGAGNAGLGVAPDYRLDVDGSTQIRDGHLYANQTTSPVATVTANAGTGASCSVDANATDIAGTLTVTTTATASSDGSQCDVAFDGSYGANPPVCVFAPANAGAAEAPTLVMPFITSTATTFSIEFFNAEAVGVNYAWTYHCIGTN